MGGAEYKGQVKLAGNGQPSARLSPLEIEIIDRFVEFSRVLGQPKSIAGIYGLRFVSPRPLSMEETIERLQISKGSTSQGLRFLRGLGAVKEVCVPGKRAPHFKSLAQLRQLATRFLRDQILAHLDGGRDRIDRLPTLVEDVPPDQRALVRAHIGMLQSWQKKTRRVLPIVLKIPGG